MTISELAAKRPYLYHVTAKENIAILRAQGELLSARSIFERGGRHELLRTRRRDHTDVCVDGTVYRVRDQRPLHPGSMALTGEMAFEEFVELLNGLVFFWPGLERGPIDMGLRHFVRYRHESPLVLRVGLRALLDANPGISPKVASVNSGAPRCNPLSGKGPRGLGTFVEPEVFPGTAGDVKEVVFDGRLRLPPRVEWGTITGKAWVRDA